MKKTHEDWMREALVLAAQAAQLGEVPVGALVVRGDELIATGFNQRERDQDPTAHAETLAMRRAAQALGSWRLDNCWVYVTLEPCPMCAGALWLSRVEGCVFGCSDPKGGFLGSLGDLNLVPGLNHRFQVVNGVLQDECASVLKSFFRSLRASKR